MSRARWTMGFQRWVAAQRWRRRAARALAPLRLTLAEWLVLDASDQLILESDDAVSQIQVGRHLELSKATLSRVMHRLERRGLVDQAPQFGGTAYRIYLSEAGKSAARAWRLRLEAVGAAWLRWEVQQGRLDLVRKFF
jgi:DNA-binding MarR family transcriptional regulator